MFLNLFVNTVDVRIPKDGFGKLNKIWFGFQTFGLQTFGLFGLFDFSVIHTINVQNPNIRLVKLINRTSENPNKMVWISDTV